MTNRIAITVLLFLVFCAGAISVRAANAVVTVTNFPNVVSNTYNGVITLQINGLTNGANSVVVQKFLDVNTNGVIDSGDPLVQQFRLTVGQVNIFTNETTTTPVTVTNFMPGSSSTATNQITVPLNFQNGDFIQSLVGQYLYKVSSPSGQFLPVTNLFVVTNAYFSSVVTGAVENTVSLTNIPNAIVLLCLNQSGPVVVQAGTVANHSGTFSLRVPPGNYLIAAAKSNFVDNVSQQGIGFTGPSTNNGTIGLTPATTNITGRVINSANSNGLAGVSGMLISTNDQVSFYFTDTNGNFYAPVVTNFWDVSVDPFAATFQDSLTWQADLPLIVSNKTVNITNALPPATAIFYGTVSNISAVPMPGVYVYAYDNAGHQSIGMTDNHGKYVVGASAGTNTWQLVILWPNNPGLTNPYVIGPGFAQTSGMKTGEAFLQNFILLKAPYTISGTVMDYEGNPIEGAVVFATNADYQAPGATTASDGTYTLNVAPGTWTVGVNATSLEDLGYTNIPANQTVTISDADASGIDFAIEVCGEIDILTTNLPDAIVGEPYDTELQAEGCQSITNWSTVFGITLTSLYDHTNFVYPPGTPIFSQSQLIGYLETYFACGLNSADQTYFTNCSATLDQVSPGAIEFENVSATVNISGPITNANGLTVFLGTQGWTATATTQNGSTYSTTLSVSELPTDGNGYSEGQGYQSTVGTMMETYSTPSNRVASVVAPLHSVSTVGNSVTLASSIPYTNLDNSVVWIRYGTNLGQYLISAYGPQSTNMDGLNLVPDGSYTAAIVGTPASTGTNGTFNFTVMAEDASSDITIQPLSLFVFPSTTLTTPTSGTAGMVQSSNTFQMQLSGLTNEFNYTVLMSTNLASSNWVPIYTVNNPTTNSLIVPDTSATNATRFYRLQISQ